jgi:zinc finger HIT domain-containing protein 3
VDLTGFENDPEFKRLITRYPQLKTQLQVIYGLTLEPGPDDERSWNRRPLFADPTARGGHNRGRGRGHSRGGRGGRHGVKRGRYEIPAEGRPRGSWTQDKGDKEALAVMKKMRAAAPNGLADAKTDGMREFIDLCLMKFGPDREVQRDGEAEVKV